jgi:hypothetical protein
LENSKINPSWRKVTMGEREKMRRRRKSVDNGHLAMSAQRPSGQFLYLAFGTNLPLAKNSVYGLGFYK